MDNLELQQAVEDARVYTVRNSYSFPDKYFEGIDAFKKPSVGKPDKTTPLTPGDATE